MNKTILHITTSLENGGAEALLFSMIKQDTANRHVVISLYTDGFYAQKLRDIGCDVHALGMARSSLSASAILKLVKLVRSTRADIIQTWMYHANFLGGVIARIFGGNRVYWGVHNTNMDPAQSSRSMLLCNRACAILSPVVPISIIHSSHTGKAILIEDGYKAAKTMVIPGGYDLDRFSPDNSNGELPDALKRQNDRVRFAMIARWNPQKDHQNLINATALLKKQCADSFEVLLIGPDMMHENTALCDAINAAECSDVIQLFGPQSNIPLALQHIDVHVLSSAFGESFPNVVNEAMACSVPCIVTDVGDSALIVDDTGWVVPPSEPLQLANAMQAALLEAREPEWQDRKQRCRARVVENFSIQSTVKAYHRAWGLAE